MFEIFTKMDANANREPLGHVGGGEEFFRV
jgi:hypothetical protein